MGGALLAHTIAGLLDGRRSLTIRRRASRRSRSTPTARSTCARSIAPWSPAGACCWPTMCATPGKTFERAKAIVEEAGGTVIATVEICDRLEPWSISACRTSRSPSIRRRRTFRPPSVRSATPGHPSARSDAGSGSDQRCEILALTRVPDRQHMTLLQAAQRSLPVLRPSRVRARSDSRSCVAMRAWTIARSSRSSRRRSRSAACLGDRVRRSDLQRAGTGAGALRPRVRSGARRRAASPLVHRWTRGDDFVALIWILRAACSRRTARSNARSPQASIRTRRTSEPRSSVLRRSRARGRSAAGVRTARAGESWRLLFLHAPVHRVGVQAHEFVSALDGSRRTTSIPADGRGCRAQLVVPLDTHTIRMGTCLGLTRRTSPGWKMASDITRALATLDPDDPVRYDFSLCHLSMMGACGWQTKRGNTQCPLRGLCRPGRGVRAGRQTNSA